MIITIITFYSIRDQFSWETNEHQAGEGSGKAEDKRGMLE